MVVFTPKASATEAVYKWAKTINGDGVVYNLSITTDTEGNVYTTGYFSGTADFDPGAGVYELSALTGYFVFVLKLDAAGDFVWAKSIGGNSSFYFGNGVIVDSAGSVYVAGSFTGTADFDPGVGTAEVTVAGVSDAFVVKLDAAGDFVWARTMGGTSGDVASSLTRDSAGNIYVVGEFQGTGDFDPGAGTATLISDGVRDIFAVKLDAAGDFVWAKQMGGTSNDVAFGVISDPLNNIYLTGYFSGTADFDPGVGVEELTSAGSNDIFAVKLDVAGDFVWAKQMGGTGNDTGRSLVMDADDNLHIVGMFEGTADFDPGVGVEELESAGDSDVFAVKLDSDGDLIWAKNVGGSGSDRSSSAAIDGTGNVYFTGYFNGTADFDPGVGTFEFTAEGSAEIFISKLDAAGDFVWAKNIKAVETEAPNPNIAADGSGNLHITGTFSDQVDFDPGAGTVNIEAVGFLDLFILKLATVSEPKLSNLAASNITKQSLTLNAEVTDSGSLAITERGFEYGLDMSYGITLSETDGPYAEGSFSVNLTNLTCNTAYHYRSYAINSEGTGYSNAGAVTTASCSSGSGGGGGTIIPAPIDTTPSIRMPDVLPPEESSRLPYISALFLRNLGYGSNGTDVRALQQFLNAAGYTVAQQGYGARGSETIYFRSLTRSAVTRFQEAYAEQILLPLGLTKGTGFFGPQTRGFVNSLFR